MNINLYDLYKRKRDKFGINESTNFQQYFVDALNITYSELNEKVFEAATLEPIVAFDDIIDTRLTTFGTITMPSGADDAIENREFWAVEWELERTADANGLTQTITDDASNVVLSITNNVFSVVGDTVAASGQIPEVDIISIKFESSKDGNEFTVNGDKVDMVYTTGDEDATQAIGAVTSNVFSAVSGYELLKTRFLTAGTLVYDFDINSGTATITDNVAGYDATVATAQWDTRYVEPSTTLDFRYRSALEMGLDYHLQDGGQYGLEPEPERERKWYTRGIQSAREVYKQNTTYVSPLNPTGA
jgi:hypothetical protein